jgi:hypothetical protein
MYAGRKYVDGSTPDISAYALFDWYQPVYYLTPVIDYRHKRKFIGRWLDVAKECTDEMAFTILAGKGNVIVRKFVGAITEEKMSQVSIQKRLAEFDESIQLEYGNKWHGASDIEESDILNTSKDKTEQQAASKDNSLELHEYTHEEMDKYLSKELHLPRGGEFAKEHVLKRSRDGDGIPTGHRHENSILDTQQYEVEFQDGSIDTYTANVIAENISDMVDPEQLKHSLFHGIINHRYDGDARRKNYTDKDGIEQPQMTTQGWEMLV